MWVYLIGRFARFRRAPQARNSERYLSDTRPARPHAFLSVPVRVADFLFARTLRSKEVHEFRGQRARGQALHVHGRNAIEISMHGSFQVREYVRVRSKREEPAIARRAPGSAFCIF
jgi:hypothetical protein